MSFPPSSMVSNYPRSGAVPPSATSSLFLTYPAPTKMQSSRLKGTSGYRITFRGLESNLMPTQTGGPDRTAYGAMQGGHFPRDDE